MTHLSPKLLIPRYPAVDDLTRPGLKLFAYGTLMPGQSAWPRFCEGRVTAAMPARIQGKLYHLPSRRFPSIAETADRTHFVSGFVLYFSDQAMLPILDEYEDFSPQRPEADCFYYRRLVPCFDPAGQPFDSAWTYFMSPARIASEGGVAWKQGLWKPVKPFDKEADSAFPA